MTHGNNNGAQSQTYGYSCCGKPQSDVIEKWAYATDANATDGGNILDTVRYPCTSSSVTHGYRAGGYINLGYSDRIDKWSFTTDGNSTDVANLLSGSAQHVGNQY